MPKPRLIPEQDILEREIISTLNAGLKEWRPDLSYPESYSDMQACVRNMLRMFDVSRRSTPRYLDSPCSGCEGLGKLITECSTGYKKSVTCPICDGKRVEKV